MNWSRGSYLTIVVMIAALATGFSQSVQAMTPREIFTRNATGIVVVVTKDPAGNFKGLGSGVIVAPHQIATNWHVIEGSASIIVRQSGVNYQARLVADRPDRDLAVLEVTYLDSPPVHLALQDALKVGDALFAIGAPSGLELSMSQGIVSGFREVDGGSLIQTTAAISPGSSGGGLFDGDGNLVGLTTLKLTSPHAENLNFAISTDWLRDLIPVGLGQDVVGKGTSDPPKNHSSSFTWWIVLLSLPIIYLMARRIILGPETMDTPIKGKPQGNQFPTISASPMRVTGDWNVTNGQAQLELGRGVSDSVRRDVEWNRSKVGGKDLDGRKGELLQTVGLSGKERRPIEVLTRTADQRIQNASITDTQRTSKLIIVTVILLAAIVLLIVAAALRLST